MADSAYPLALADRAFAYEGAYRTPNAMSAASRAAYGMHRRTSSSHSKGFRYALKRAAADPGSTKPIVSARSQPCAGSSPPHASGPARTGAPQRDADPDARAAHSDVSVRAIARRPSSAYYLFVSSSGSIVRAIVWRGRIFSGGARSCPISTP